MIPGAGNEPETPGWRSEEQLDAGTYQVLRLRAKH
jgi:hypothetical protein